MQSIGYTAEGSPAVGQPRSLVSGAAVTPSRLAVASQRSPLQGEVPNAKNICCVGDDDQSIYGWRGAEVDNILRFEHDFPGAIVIRLERNYRSTGHILAAASHIIAHNEGRLGKTLRTDDVLGEKVSVTGSWDSEEEARVIGEEIEQLQRSAANRPHRSIRSRSWCAPRSRCANSKTASSRSACPIASSAGRASTSAPKSATRSPICAWSIRRPTISPSSASSMCPSAGSATPPCSCLHDHARKRRVPLTEAARAVIETDELKPKPRGALRAVLEAFDRWRKQRDALPHNELAEIVLDESGYTEMWQKDRSADAAGRLENLKELVRSMEEFENLQGFLEHISLVMDNEKGAEADAVNVMTLHSAKGLEFDTVFLPGWEEGLFPHQRTLDDQGRAGLEEERRLAHVGLTRARKRAKIYFATNRRMHGLWQTNIPSRFLDELPEANVEVTESQGGFGGYGGYGASRFDATTSFGSSYSTPGWQRAQARKPGNGDGFSEADADYETEDDLSHLSPRGRGRAAGAGEGRRRSSRRTRPPRAAHHRRRAGGEIHRHRLRLHARRPRLPPEIRQRQRHRHRRQQADDPVRPRRGEAGGG